MECKCGYPFSVEGFERERQKEASLKQRLINSWNEGYAAREKVFEERLKKEGERFSEDIWNQGTIIVDLSNGLDAANEKAAHFEKKVKDMEEYAHGRELKISELQELYDRVNVDGAEELAKKDQHITELKNSISELRNELFTTNEEAKQLRGEVWSAKCSEHRMRGDRTAYEKENDSLIAELELIHKKNEELEEDLEVAMKMIPLPSECLTLPSELRRSKES